MGLAENIAQQPAEEPRYAFIVPRFGEGIGGGAETLVGALAARLAARGNKVEVFSTCARDNRSWEDSYPPGQTVENGLTVNRFRVDSRNLEAWIPLQIRIADGLRLGLEEQFEWINNGVNSQALYAALMERAAEFSALFFAPYLFSTTFYGALLCPQKSFLIPCLHDEYYAYTETIQSMFRQVRGCIFNSAAERDLARRLFGEIKGDAVGMGFEPQSKEEMQRLAPYFAENFPYILYLGRKETGKGVQLLIDYFIALKEQGGDQDLKLVIAGGGSFSDLYRGAALARDDIIDVCQVTEDEKRRLLRHALVLCQPSTNESFSIVLMEAWCLNAPVLVNAACPVTRQHVLESGGGLYFSGAQDFAAVVEELLANRALAAVLGEAGRNYVLREYNWGEVLKRFDSVMAGFADG